MPKSMMYSSLRSMGADNESAAYMAGVDPKEGRDLDTARALPPDDEMFKSAALLARVKGGNNTAAIRAVPAYAESLGTTVDSLYYENSDAAKGHWWDGPLDKAMKVANTIDIPRQLLYRTLTGDDIRKAIPEHMLTDAVKNRWANEGVAHEIMNFGDIVNNKFDNAWALFKEERNQGGAFEKWVVGGGASVAMFVGDVVTDPMTYIGGLGLGKKASALMRKTLPKAATASALAKIAKNAPSAVTSHQAVKAYERWMDDLADKALNHADEAVRLDAKKTLMGAEADYRDLIDNLRTYKADKNVGIAATPTRLVRDLPPLPPNATEVDKAVRAARVKALEMEVHSLRWEDMSEQTMRMRANLGPDAAEEVNEAMVRVIAGAADEDVVMKTPLNAFAETRTSVDLRLNGIGKRGEILIEKEGHDEIIKVVTQRQGELTAHRDYVKSMKNQTKKRVAEVRKGIKERSKVEEKLAALKASMPAVQAEITKTDDAINALIKERDTLISQKTLPADKARLRDEYAKKMAPLKHRATALNKQVKSSWEMNKQLTEALEQATKVSGLTGDITMAVPKFVMQEEITRVGDEIAVLQRELAELYKKGDEVNEIVGPQIRDLKTRISAANSGKRVAERQLARIENAILKGDDALAAIKAGGNANMDELIETTFMHGQFDAAQELAEERLHSIARNMAHYRDHGVFPPELYQNPGIKFPKGPRRDVLESTKYLDEKYGAFVSKFWTPVLYPKSVMPRFMPLAMSYFFREPMRVLEERMPGMWELINGRMKAQQYEINDATMKVKDIMLRAGVIHAPLGEGKLAKGFKHITGLNADLTHQLNKEQDNLLFRLLNVAKDSPEWKEISLEANEKILKAHDEMREVLDYYATKLGYPPGSDMYIEGYMTHLMSPDFFKNGWMPREFEGTRATRIKRWMEHDRKGEEFFTDSAVEAMDIYVRGVAKVLFTDPVVREIHQGVARYADLNKSSAATMRKFATMLTNQLEGKPSVLGHLLEALPGEMTATRVRQVASKLALLTYSSALTGNHRYMVMSLTQGINTTSAEFGVLRSLKALAKMHTAEGRLTARVAGIENVHKKLFEETSQKWGDIASDLRVAMFPSISDTEFLIRGVTFHASLDEQLRIFGYTALDDVLDEGIKKEVIAKAVADSESINHVFGKLGKPVLFSNISHSGSALATQFFSFPFKQTETLFAHTFKDPGFIVDYLIMAGQMVKLGFEVNVDVSPYVGVEYLPEASRRDMMSMPVETLAATVSWANVAFNDESNSMDKLAAQDRMMRGLENLIPFKAAWRNHATRKQKAKGTTYSAKGHMARTGINVGPSTTAEGGKPEMMSMIMAINSLQDSVHRTQTKAHYDRKAEIRAAMTQLSRTALDGMVEGKDTSKERAAIARHLRALGNPIDVDTMMEKLRDAAYLRNVSQEYRFAVEGGVGQRNHVQIKEHFQGWTK